MDGFLFYTFFRVLFFYVLTESDFSVSVTASVIFIFQSVTVIVTVN